MSNQPIKANILYEDIFSNEVIQIIDFIRNDFSKSYPIKEITPEVFILASLSREDRSLYLVVNSFVNSFTIDEIVTKLLDKITETSSGDMVGSNMSKSIDYSSSLKSYFSQSCTELFKIGGKYITSDVVMLAILNSSKSFLKDMFLSYGFDYQNMIAQSAKFVNIIDDIEVNEKEAENTYYDIVKGTEETSNQKKIKTIRKSIPYCTNLNELAEKKEIDPLVGRESEINEIIKTLFRKKNNNVVLVGDSGVGKTQIVYGIANKIVSKSCPFILRKSTIYQLNPNEMVSGTSLRGMYEERINSVIKALKSEKNCILFIDNIDMLFENGGKNEYDISGFVSDLFTDGKIQIIACTNHSGYKNMCNYSKDVVSRMQKITIDANSTSETCDILNDCKKTYEKYHNVKYSRDIIKTIVNLSNRYITEQKLPASAIDVMDYVGSYKKLSLQMSSEYNELLNNLEELEGKKAKLLLDNSKDSIDIVEHNINDLKLKLSNFENGINKKPCEITEEDVYACVSNMTKIPVSKISSDEKNSLAQLSNVLKSSIIGQDEAIELVSKAIKRNKVGLYKKSKPIYSCLCIGQSGVGKTLLAKKIAECVFGNESNLIRFDMSEYADKTSVNKLIGASAGYVGFDNGGLLTEAVRRNKYSVVLIDEIEKADSDVYNLFLQVLDEGFLSDNIGNKIDFKNTIIILTSNVGVKEANGRHSLGFNGNDNIIKKDIVEKELKKKFPPEFINRLDDIVYFNSFTDENLKDIVRLELNKLNERLNNCNFTMKYTNDVVEFIFNKTSDEREYGARPIIRCITNEIENKLTDIIIENDYSSYDFSIQIEDNEICIK